MDDDLERRRGFAAAMLFKQAGEAVNAPILSGRLVASSSGWLLLEVPNSLVRGVFDALDAPGAELPTKHTGALNAHISVARPEEIKQLGGIEKITERGLRFKYQLGPLQEVTPAGWKGVSKCWFIRVKSPELEKLRKSYGLSAKPNNDKFDFHITAGIRKAKVLQANPISKAAGVKSLVLQKLLAAKAESDRKNYAAKHALLRQALSSDPTNFEVDSQESKYPGLTHKPTGFQTHAPRDVVNYLQQLSATAP